MDAAAAVPIEKRDLYLQRIAAMLALRGRGRFTDADVAHVARLAIAGLVHSDIPARCASSLIPPECELHVRKLGVGPATYRMNAPAATAGAMAGI
ncbi:MAG: hypothetical protein WBC86_04145 [Pseudolabrys sp.]